MQSRDSRLQLIRTGSAKGDRRVEHGDPLIDHLVVPPGTILIFEQHEVAAWRRCARCAVECCSSISASSPCTSASPGSSRSSTRVEPDRLVAQIDAHEVVAARRAVALVEHEVEHREDAVEPLLEEVPRRHTVGDAGVADLLLGSNEPLRHRRLRCEEGSRDLPGRQPADRAKRERDAGFHRQ